MKKFLALLMVALLAISLVACKSSGDKTSSSNGNSTGPAVKSYTVAFEVDGERYKTLKVNDGEKITTTVADPTKEGHSFTGWTLAGQVVTLTDYVVTKDVTFTAQFKKNDVNANLNVTDTKEDGKTYYLVVGWWETTALETDGVTPKHTSYLDEDQVRLFYSNLILYLKAKGATEKDLAAVSVRNYSSEKVADMGSLVLADGDVDIMIGVGNNVNSQAGLALYEASNDNKFATEMGSTPTSRYVALLSSTNELGVNVFDWLKTDTGKQAFKKQLTASEITVVPERSNEIDLTVTVHGDTDAVTALTDDQTAITLPAITVADDKVFKGFALTADGEVALAVAIDAEIKYNDVKKLVATGEKTLDLYPVFGDKPTGTALNVYIQINGNNLYEYEAKLFEARFTSTLTAEEKENVVFHFETAAADDFKATVNSATDVDVVIGGNNPVNSFAAHTDGAITNVAAKHFVSTNRKVIIANNTDNLDLAKKLYSFATAEAVEFELHVAFWTKNGDWVTADEEAKLKTNIEATVKTALNITGEETLEGKYNVKLTFVDVTTEGNKVADLGAATNALFDGKGTDLIVGCGGNVDTTGGVTIVEKQKADLTILSKDRYVALVTDNYLTRLLYTTCFTVTAE